MSIDSTLSRRMTLARELDPQQRFVPAVLPWAIAGGALLLYLLTLNHWVSVGSLFHVARISGWTWQPELEGPLYWLLTYPLRWLPASAIPAALNLFSLVCAVLVLALLARSVALLPHDRTEAQRTRERSEFSLLSISTAWLPPVLAALVCGLELTFWENATAASHEMLDLLVFAYVIRCLLEFRIGEQDSWLLRASLVYGAGMANNWAMVAFFPLFLVAMVWIKGKSFFEARFLGRMFFLGITGVSLYLLLPLVSALSGENHPGFWEALRTNLATQKRWVFTLPYNKSVLMHGIDAFHADKPLWVLGLPALLPTLLMGIRWPRFFGDLSKLGIALNQFIFHFVHFVFLGVCLWIALDPDKFSPRHLLPGLPMLTFYYLGALCVGYYSGYVLLVFGAKPVGRPRPVPGYMPLIDKVAVAAVWVMLGLIPALMIYQNLTQVRITNGRLLKNYAGAMMQSVPTQSSVFLSDDPAQLFLLESALTQAGRSQNCLFLDTGALAWPDYHRFLKKKRHDWPSVASKNIQQIGDVDLIRLVASLAQSNSVYYLHPSFGYYFEVFYAQPQGLLYQLNLYPTNRLLAPAVDKELLGKDIAFWNQFDDTVLKPLVSDVSVPETGQAPSPFQRVAHLAHLANEPNRDASLLARFYSRSVNGWGVDLQRAGQQGQAGPWFRRALELNSENAIAQVNLDFNADLLAGRKSVATANKTMDEQFRKYHSWDQVMRDNGPFDEPSFCYAQGWAFLQGGNYRQAAEEFARVITLAPDNLPSRLLLAQIYTSVRMPDDALKIAQDVRAAPAVFGLSRTNEPQVLAVEVSGYLAKDDLKRTEEIVDTALKKYPNDEGVLATVAKAYMDFGRYTNALPLLEQQLKIRPDNQDALLSKGNACLQIKAFDQAIEPLTRVIQTETTNFTKLHYMALFMRAKAYLNSGKLDEAQSDYEVLQKALPTEFPVYYDLGEIAYRRKDTRLAIEHYQHYLANVPTNFTEDIKFVSERLNKLKQGSL
jgi:tetratricopeptide (TPR) repeat protein